MNKKYGWTLAELLMAMMFVMAISGFLISNFKPNQQNGKIKAYAAIRNIEKAIIAVEDRYLKAPVDESGTSTTRKTIFYNDDTAVNSNNTFCRQMADVLSVKTSNCTRVNGTKTTPDITLPNGVEIYGLSSQSFNFYNANSTGNNDIEGKKYAYKNILIDIDGPKGRNRIGVDRFPLRIYAVDNVVLPVNCGETQFYDWRHESIFGGGKGTVTLSDSQKHPYCKAGKTFNGSRSSQNFMLDTEMLTYDTYKNNIKSDTCKQLDKDGNEVEVNCATVEAKDTMIRYSRSLAETICGVYGGTKFLSRAQCAALGFKIYKECPTKDSCGECGKNTAICPEGTSNESTCLTLYNNLNNKQNLCYFYIHRPSAAMSAVVKGIIGDELDME